jgi:hypothetical protein
MRCLSKTKNDFVHIVYFLAQCLNEVLHLLSTAMADKRDRRRDTIVEYYDHENEAVQSKLDRVVLVSIDENSAEYVYNWTLDNFIQPERDLVVLTHVRVLELPMAPYVDSTGYLEEEAEERRQESHQLLKEYASRLWHKRVNINTN